MIDGGGDEPMRALPGLGLAWVTAGRELACVDAGGPRSRPRQTPVLAPRRRAARIGPRPRYEGTASRAIK